MERMLARLSKHRRLGVTVYFAVVSAFCISLSLLRVAFTGTSGFLFLNWNLVLAFIPWLLTSFMILWELTSTVAILLVMTGWLLFFPNSLYILTDLIHLGRVEGAPAWLDLILLLSFAWTGLCFGFASLMDIEGKLSTRFGLRRRTVTLFSIGMLFLAAFGIYLGRFLRWNTWDLLGYPGALLDDIFDPFADPAHNLRFWGFTLAMGTLLNLMYFGVRMLVRKPVPVKSAGPAPHPGTGGS
jgi:uncharacterized membrane protein